MTCDNAIDFIHSRLKFGSVPGLERIEALCEKLGNPQDKLRYVHVAGTNGKGSTTMMISNMLMSAGYKTGIFTSPFVIDFRERIQINGEMISKEDLAETVEQVKSCVEELDSVGICPTEFEVLTATAFLYFSNQNCTAVVLEVGMGGLYDSTNIIKNTDVCVLTSISYDHTQVLGETIEEIAFNKAGIIKDNSAVVIYPQLFEGAEKVILNSAKEHGCTVFSADKSDIIVMNSDLSGSEFTYKNQTIKTTLVGSHQILNAITAYEAGLAMIAKGFNITQTDIKNGIQKATIPARVQIVSKDPLIVIDGAHNKDGVCALCDNIKKLFTDRKITAVIGMMKDKDIDSVVKMLAPLCNKMISVTVDNPRTISAIELKEKLKPYCNNVEACDDPIEAFNNAKLNLDKDEMLLVCGSLYLAAQIENIIKR